MSNIGTCSRCGDADVVIEMHHTDYEKDITVPMCQSCHKKLHAALRRNGTPLSPPTKFIPKTGMCGLKFLGRVVRSHQVTIPEATREMMGINVGDMVYMEIIEVKPSEEFADRASNLIPEDKNNG